MCGSRLDVMCESSRDVNVCVSTRLFSTRLPGYKLSRRTTRTVKVNPVLCRLNTIEGFSVPLLLIRCEIADGDHFFVGVKSVKNMWGINPTESDGDRCGRRQHDAQRTMMPVLG